MKPTLFQTVARTGVLIILALPLLNIPPFFSPPDWGKAIAFRLVLSVLLLVFAWQILCGKQKLPNISWRSTQGILICLLVLFLGIFLLATVFSVDPAFSFLGDPQRSGGTLNLTFLVLFALFLFAAFPQEQSWRLFTNGLLLAGAAVSFVAIMQWQGWFSTFLVTTGARPTSTMGSAMTLALFLLPLLFLAFAMFAKATSSHSRMLYGALATLFAFVLFLTETRAALLGLAAGFFFFLGWYPTQHKKYSLILKGILIAVFLVGGGVFFAANTVSSPPSVLKRLQLETLTQDSRFAAWQVTIKALQERPLLGYGPENFSVGFDKYYNRALPGMDRIQGGTLESWWDRAHNLLLDTAMQAGLGAAFTLLMFLGVLLWKLQQTKKQPQLAFLAHSIQASLIAYFVADFFSFDTFGVQLVLFFLFALSFHLISRQPEGTPAIQAPKNMYRNQLSGLGISSLAILAFILLWLNWQTAIVPLVANAQINRAQSLVEQRRCEDAFALMDETSLTKQSSLRAYIGLTYADMILRCREQNPALRIQLAQKGLGALNEALQTRPSYIRGWITFGGLTNGILENELATSRDSSRISQLTQGATAAFQQALVLGPKRQEVYVEWAKMFLVLKNYEGAKQKARECLGIDPESKACWWQLARAEISLGNAETGSAALRTAGAKGYALITEQAYLQLANAYLAAKDYENMAAVYNEVINHDYGPNNAQHYASFAAVNKILHRNEEARRGALGVLLLNPAAKEDVRAFFSTLPGCDSERFANQPECYTMSALLRLYLKEPGAEEALRTALAFRRPKGTPLRVELHILVKDAAKQYLVADPANADFHLASAIILQSFGSSQEQAKAEALKAQELNPNKKDIVDLFIKNL